MTSSAPGKVASLGDVSLFAREVAGNDEFLVFEAAPEGVHVWWSAGSIVKPPPVGTAKRSQTQRRQLE